MMRVIRKTLLLALLLVGCSNGEQVQTLSGSAQGTTWHISLWKPGGVDTHALQQRIEVEFRRLDALLSNYRPDSVIEQFNADSTAGAVTVGKEIVSLVQMAQKVSESSQGCYDLTIKPLFDLWGFNGDKLTPPDQATLERVLNQTGYRKLDILIPDRLRKAHPDLRVDLSSIAQGYSVSRIAAELETAGIESYLVEIGGELQARGHKSDGSHWRIGVERPLPGGRSVQKVLTISRDAPMAVMTSGTYRHYFDVQGKRYSHVLDARTGSPIDHSTLSVTVLNDNPTLADAWSTALLCLGRNNGVKIADSTGIAALFITEHHGQLEETVTSAWHAIQDIQEQ